jgi:hypothetical protein
LAKACSIFSTKELSPRAAAELPGAMGKSLANSMAKMLQ